MAAPAQAPGFALRPDLTEPELPHGAWWPEDRRLDDQLGNLFALWPPDHGRPAPSNHGLTSETSFDVARQLSSIIHGLGLSAAQTAWENEGGHVRP